MRNGRNVHKSYKNLKYDLTVRLSKTNKTYQCIRKSIGLIRVNNSHMEFFDKFSNSFECDKHEIKSRHISYNLFFEYIIFPRKTWDISSVGTSSSLHIQTKQFMH
ncbi:hypothetical protein CsSME_00051093 [Camellia sinensis var. sinensis]